jgi:hypothetical protein
MSVNNHSNTKGRQFAKFYLSENRQKKINQEAKSRQNNGNKLPQHGFDEPSSNIFSEYENMTKKLVHYEETFEKVHEVMLPYDRS